MATDTTTRGKHAKGRGFVAASAVGVLCLAFPSLAHAESPAPSEPDSCWVGASMGLGASAIWREGAAPLPFGAATLQANLLLGTKLNDGYSTGLGVRASWSPTRNFNLARDDSSPAHHNQVVQGTAYWFHQLGDWRLALGPHLSWTISDSEEIPRTPLFGAELSVDWRILSARKVNQDWTGGVWLGVMLSHALVVANDAQLGARETVIGGVLSFELDTVPTAK